MRRNDSWILTALTLICQVTRLSSLLSPLLCCCDLGCREPLGAPAGGSSVDTALCLCWLHLSAPPLCWLQSFKILPFLPFPHPALFLLANSRSPATVSTRLTSPSLRSLPAPAVHPPLCPFVSSTLTSVLNQLSFCSLFVKPYGLAVLFPWLFWQPSV